VVGPRLHLDYQSGLAEAPTELDDAGKSLGFDDHQVKRSAQPRSAGSRSRWTRILVFIGHGVVGLMLPRESLHRLGEAVLELLDWGPDFAEAVGTAARQRVQTSFYPEIERNLLKRVIDHILPTGT